MTLDDKVPALLESRADGTSQTIARVALTTSQFDWDPRKAISELPTGSAPSVRAARDKYRESLTTLEHLEPDLKGSLSRSVRDAFAPIGAKMRPDMGLEQAAVWAAAIVVAFADLPPWIAVQALREAVHIPFEFPNDMEAKVRDIAEAKLLRHRIAVLRLEQCLEAFRGAFNPAPRLEDSSEEPMSLDDARELINGVPGMRKTLLDMALGSGAIRPEDFEILKAEEPATSERICEGPDGSMKS